MGKMPSFQFYPGDWLRDSVASCSLPAQGLWLRLMIIMHDSERYGYLQENGRPMSMEAIARRVGCYNGVTELLPMWNELVTAGVPRITEDGVYYSKRMAEDAAARDKARARVRKHRTSVTPVKRFCNANVQRSSSSSSSSSSISSLDPPLSPLDDLPTNLDIPECQAALARWLKYKQEKGKAYKPIGLQGLFKKLSEWGPDTTIRAIEFSIASNYDGLFPPKTAPPTNGHGRLSVTEHNEHFFKNHQGTKPA